ncbi:hypothetical protein EX30DRAFT_126333 [Ascodesmis nigricans]|uniref:Uncharacterized protein n=1 Tax=Ascodesmis nigricans TaxID=341454 RepID=A0A4S2MPC9_9PEZI|nr:hypothetical protein EX30DRAFT_126333 [Ascodesmis nigricans]
MPPTRPAPLKTSGHGFGPGSSNPFSPLPSTLPRTPITGYDPLRAREEILKTPISPPAAYTEFLKNTINSPALSSPRTLPYSPVTSSMSNCRGHRGYLTPATPYPPPLTTPISKKPRARSPQSPVSVASSRTASRSSSDDEDGSGDSETHRGVKHVVAQTAKLDLLPAPKGKRRRIE